MDKGYKRLAPGQPVGLRHAGYIIAVQNIIKVSGSGHRGHEDGLWGVRTWPCPKRKGCDGCVGLGAEGTV